MWACGSVRIKNNEKYNNIKGVYRVDGIYCIRYLDKWQWNWKIKEKMHEYAKSIGMRIEIENKRN